MTINQNQRNPNQNHQRGADQRTRDGDDKRQAAAKDSQKDGPGIGKGGAPQQPREASPR